MMADICETYCTSDCHSDDCEHHGHLPWTDPEQAIGDATRGLILAFRRWTQRTYGKPPSEDDFRDMLEEAALLAPPDEEAPTDYTDNPDDEYPFVAGVNVVDREEAPE